MRSTDKPKTSPKAPKELRWARAFAWAIVVSSLIHMHKLVVDRDWYMSVYAELGDIRYLRYAFSWFQRIVGITLGIGLLRRQNWARVGGMALGIFTALTIYWKHPYGPFYKNALTLNDQYGPIYARLGLPPMRFETLTIPAIIFHCLLDIGFWALYIHTMTRPRVREYFRTGI